MGVSRTMRAGWSLFRIKLAEGFLYRLAALTGATTSIFYALVEIAIMMVFFTHSDLGADAGNGMSLRQAISYIWIGQALQMLSPRIDSDIRTMIQNGDVGIELCRPLGLYALWFFRCAAGRLSEGIRSGVTILAGLMIPAGWGLAGPASLLGFGMFILSGITAVLLMTSFVALMCAVRMNVNWGEWSTNTIMLLGNVLSGSHLPLQLWPDFMQGFLLIQPFAGYLDLPGRLYVGTMQPMDGLLVMSLQLGWTAIFILAGRYILSRHIKKIIVQGG